MSRAARIAAIRSSLLAWYDASARDLPWRRTRDPYAIWIAEVMLQQTRVETVRPYYQRFLARWPTAAELARAELDDVLAAWSGLGYYRRARLLHQGARHVAELFGNRIRKIAAGTDHAVRWRKSAMPGDLEFADGRVWATRKVLAKGQVVRFPR